jgi:hypothetical protein
MPIPALARIVRRERAPGLTILVISLAFNALGESLRIVLGPTMNGSLSFNRKHSCHFIDY